ncbi:helix-turn-helix transcriptional regulator [Pedobacter sp. FW305-3-2-15-E-R2A2]|jgi:AraC-like DNA-binding protein|uniref:helix-turn-helix domain-containing protein n=1 Tax=Pedobacter sp. FW305-3-2-15-E-R2A2 TaxID=3140251 RepID=UPI0031400439
MENIIKYFHKEITDHKISIYKIFGSEVTAELLQKPAHRRGDHYLFIFQKEGSSKLMLDFQEVTLTGSVLLCILPGQIHHTISVENHTEAWLITVDSNFLIDEHRSVFDDYYFRYAPIPLGELAGLRINQCIELIAVIVENGTELNYEPLVLDSLIRAFVGMFISVYRQVEDRKSSVLRTAILTREFKRILLRQFKTKKSTTDYAACLNITPSYLNESVKLTTGFPVTFWIQQTIIMEAKRLLYDTDHTVKEVAYLLGYTDHAYFNRYFSNAVGQPPLQFRLSSRK